MRSPSLLHVQENGLSSMKLFVLRRAKADYCDPNGYCVLAENEGHARALARMADDGDSNDWQSPSFASCEEIDTTAPRIVLVDMPTG
jgi:hypothetical protein